jgi:hypothetical protein
VTLADAAAAALGTVFLCSCAFSQRQALESAELAQLWRAPHDLEQRDLFFGPGGAGHAPDPADRYEMIEVNASGVNPGYDVRDSRGQRWSVKLGVESRTEVVVSRILWAVGYHQPVIYHMPRWTFVRDGKDTLLSRARFRLEPPLQDKKGEWSWRDNAFVGTRQLAGLYVLMVLFNNWDLKTAQNAVYRVTHDSSNVETWFMVRDLGASLGRSAWFTFGARTIRTASNASHSSSESRGTACISASPGAGWSRNCTRVSGRSMSAGSADCWRASRTNSGLMRFAPAAMGRPSPSASSADSNKRWRKGWQLPYNRL